MFLSGRYWDQQTESGEYRMTLNPSLTLSISVHLLFVEPSQLKVRRDFPWLYTHLTITLVKIRDERLELRLPTEFDQIKTRLYTSVRQ